MKKYECIGLSSDCYISWGSFFEIGKEYYEAELTEEEQKFSTSNTLRMKDNQGRKWWVPKDQFNKIE